MAKWTVDIINPSYTPNIASGEGETFSYNFSTNRDYEDKIYKIIYDSEDGCTTYTSVTVKAGENGECQGALPAPANPGFIPEDEPAPEPGSCCTNVHLEWTSGADRIIDNKMVFESYEDSFRTGGVLTVSCLTDCVQEGSIMAAMSGDFAALRNYYPNRNESGYDYYEFIVYPIYANKDCKDKYGRITITYNKNDGGQCTNALTMDLLQKGVAKREWVKIYPCLKVIGYDEARGEWRNIVTVGTHIEDSSYYESTIYNFEGDYFFDLKVTWIDNNGVVVCEPTYPFRWGICLSDDYPIPTYEADENHDESGFCTIKNVEYTAVKTTLKNYCYGDNGDVEFYKPSDGTTTYYGYDIWDLLPCQPTHD